jgi:hypothetical protein
MGSLLPIAFMQGVQMIEQPAQRVGAAKRGQREDQRKEAVLAIRRPDAEQWIGKTLDCNCHDEAEHDIGERFGE